MNDLVQIAILCDVEMYYLLFRHKVGINFVVDCSLNHDSCGS